MFVRNIVTRSWRMLAALAVFGALTGIVGGNLPSTPAFASARAGLMVSISSTSATGTNHQAPKAATHSKPMSFTGFMQSVKTHKYVTVWRTGLIDQQARRPGRNGWFHITTHRIFIGTKYMGVYKGLPWSIGGTNPTRRLTVDFWRRPDGQLECWVIFTHVRYSPMLTATNPKSFLLYLRAGEIGLANLFILKK